MKVVDNKGHMRTTPENLLKGQAGVYQVASQLCLRGFNPHFPAVDVGADLVIDAGVRIQVKSTHLRFQSPYPNGAYWFKLGTTRIEKRRQVWRNVKFSEFCDFVVFWGIDQNRFWVIPAPELDDHQCLVLGPDTWYRDLDAAKLREMADSGMTQSEIAKAVGTTQITISRRLRGQYTISQKTFGQTARRHENDWELIHSYIGLLRGAPELSQQSQGERI